MLDAATSLGLPTAVPGGRALLKLPVAKTVLPTMTWLQTTPLTCHVGNASALTVGGVPGSGAVSAWPTAAVDNPRTDSPSATMMAVTRGPAAARRTYLFMVCSSYPVRETNRDVDIAMWHESAPCQSHSRQTFFRTEV